MSLKAAVFYDENLNAVPRDPVAFVAHVHELQERLDGETNPEIQVRLLGELGACQRTLGQFRQAENDLLRALDLTQQHQLGLKLETQQEIRLAHVLQSQGRFAESTSLFESLIDACRSQPTLATYLPFALQHAGKNLFDQERYLEALILFKQALELRERDQAPQDQIDSTQHAIQITATRLK